MPRLGGKIDLMYFNPPYVLTPSEEVGSHSVEAAWAGGIDGREVIDEFMPYIKVLNIFDHRCLDLYAVM